MAVCGTGTGLPQSEAFLGGVGSAGSPAPKRGVPAPLSSSRSPGVCHRGPGLRGRTPHVRWGCPAYPSPSPRPSAGDRWCRNVDRLSIACAFRLRLRSRLTLRRLTFRRNPWAFGAPGFHRGWRYSFRDSHSPPLHPNFHRGFTAGGTLPYHPSLLGGRIRGFGGGLSPVHLWRRLPRASARGAKRRWRAPRGQ